MSVPLRLSRGLVGALTAHAAQAYPAECCGALLLDPGGDVEARALENVAARGFEVPARALLALMREADTRQLRLVGFYHSHPDGPPEPSARDAAAAWPGLWTVVIPVFAGVPEAPRLFQREEGGGGFVEVPQAS